MHPMWKTYKSKVLKTLNPDLEEDAPQEDHDVEVENDVSPVQEDERPNAVTQMAKKMQGAGARGWNRMSVLFNKDDEHQLLEETESPPVADHPLAAPPEEPRPAKRSGFWDAFATKLHQKQAEAAATAAAAVEAEPGPGGVEGGEEAGGEGGRQDGERAEGGESEGDGGGGGGGSGSNSFSKYTILGGGGGGEETSFKWNFVTSKLAELKTKTTTKTN